MSKRSKVIFNPSEIVAACEQVEENGGDFGEIFSIDKTARSGPQGTRYLSLFAKVGNKFGRLNVRIINQKHVGQIAPQDITDLNELNATRRDGMPQLKQRDRHPTINIQKYSKQVEVDDAGKLKDELPGKEFESDFFKMIAYLDEFFYNEMSSRIDAGDIIERDDRRTDIPKGCIQVDNKKICSLYQRKVSAKSTKNPGMSLVNPITRLTMKFDKQSGRPKKAKFYDLQKAYKNKKGGKSYEELRFDDVPVNSHNVHNIASHSIVSGLVSLNAVCISNMGISIPKDIEVLVVDAPEVYGMDIGDVFVTESSDEKKKPEEEKPKEEIEEKEVKPKEASSSSASSSNASAVDTAIKSMKIN